MQNVSVHYIAAVHYIAVYIAQSGMLSLLTSRSVIGPSPHGLDPESPLSIYRCASQHTSRGALSSPIHHQSVNQSINQLVNQSIN